MPKLAAHGEQSLVVPGFWWANKFFLVEDKVTKISRSKKEIVSVLLITLAFSLTACSGQDSGSNLQLNITPEQVKIKPGGQQLFSVSVKDSQGNTLGTVIPTSSSSKPMVASVTENGLAAGLQEGTAQIMASTGEVSAAATLDVTASAPRPVEVVNVIPEENTTTSLSSCPLPCLGPPLLGAIGAGFSFLWEDTFESARLFIDGTEVTSDAQVTTNTGIPGIEGNIAYDILLHPIAPGLHQVAVEAKSQAGQTVTYTWNFTITE